ncbi:MAG: hypothetical protein ACOYLQ_06145 [Hyphomicrobiaceae bacterium]
MSTPTASTALFTIKLAHTAIWAFFVACIVAIWVFALQARYPIAALMIGIVLIEAIVLALNGRRCPLTSWAGRYTDDRQANFDIFLPAPVAANTKLIFGTLYLTGAAVTFARWALEPQ